MTDDLLTRLTTALMDAMGCKEASIFGPGNCRLHVNVLRPGPKHMGWPCPVATQCAEALLPFVRSEVADTLERIARRWQFSDWADAPRDSDPVRERLGNAQYVTTWLLARAKEV